MIRAAGSVVVSAVLLWSAIAIAEGPTSDVGGPAAGISAAAAPLGPQPSPPVAQTPYSLPWQLRPAGAVTALRLDTSFAGYTDPATHEDGSTIVSMLAACYKVTPNLAPLVRVGFVQNSAGGPAVDVTG